MTLVQRAQQICLVLEATAREIEMELPKALAGGEKAREALLERLHRWQDAVSRAQDQFQSDFASIDSARAVRTGGSEQGRQMAFRANQSLSDQGIAIKTVAERVRKVSKGVAELAKRLSTDRRDIERLLVELVKENAEFSHAQLEAQQQINEALAEGAIDRSEGARMMAEIRKPVRQAGSATAHQADPFGPLVLVLIVLRVALSRRKR